MTDLETWFAGFWSCYPADLCHKKKGSRKNAFTIIEKLNPDTDMQNKILGNLRELVRFYRLERKANGKTDRWPMATTWLNGEMWNNVEDIGSYSDANDKIASRKCACGNDTEHVNQCWDCYGKSHPNPYEKQLKAESKRIGLWKLDGETLQQWRDRSRAWHKSRRSMGSAGKAG